MTNSIHSFETLREARKFRRSLKAMGISAKIFMHTRTYTVPFKGITTSVEYTVEVR